MEYVSYIPWIILGLVYIYPTVAAIDFHHRQRWAIALLNLFLGWTFLGWVVALVWAYSTPQPTPLQSSGAASPPVRPLDI